VAGGAGVPARGPSSSPQAPAPKAIRGLDAGAWGRGQGPTGPWPLPQDTNTMRKLINCLKGCRRAVLLFSGGLDSSLLLAVAAETLGSGLTALTFSGPHTAPGELAAAFTLARRRGVRHLIHAFDPLALPAFRENTPERCYACKKALLQRAWKVARTLGAEALWDGTNLDDLAHFRPGLKAARELGTHSPLVEAGLDKAAIRNLSRALGLNWQKAPQSCLATRFPYNTTLTREALRRVGQAEAWLRNRGFSYVRLRIERDQARLELLLEEWPVFLAPAVRLPFNSLLARLGWRGVDLDVLGEEGQGSQTPGLPSKPTKNHG
jgi:uncharacterized protein